jgi:hypothetical protein
MTDSTLEMMVGKGVFVRAQYTAPLHINICKWDKMRFLRIGKLKSIRAPYKNALALLEPETCNI